MQPTFAYTYVLFHLNSNGISNYSIYSGIDKRLAWWAVNQQGHVTLFEDDLGKKR